MHFHEDHDFKEWEQFHNIVAKDSVPFDISKPLPKYFQEYLKSNN
jgi:hypothetical protein